MLPAIEWLYSERVRQLAKYAGTGYEWQLRAKDASGTLSDEAVLAAADFGLFVDLSSMCQKPKRTTNARRSRTASSATLSAART